MRIVAANDVIRFSPDTTLPTSTSATVDVVRFINKTIVAVVTDQTAVLSGGYVYYQLASLNTANAGIYRAVFTGNVSSEKATDAAEVGQRFSQLAIWDGLSWNDPGEGNGLPTLNTGVTLSENTYELLSIQENPLSQFMVLFVSPAGSDSNSGSIVNPMLTAAFALSQAVASQIVYDQTQIPTVQYLKTGSGSIHLASSLTSVVIAIADITANQPVAGQSVQAATGSTVTGSAAIMSVTSDGTYLTLTLSAGLSGTITPDSDSLVWYQEIQGAATATSLPSGNPVNVIVSPPVSVIT
jgi:hypothetical protein